MVAFYLTVKTYDSLVEMHGWEEPVAAIRAAFAKGDTDRMAAAVTHDMLDAITIHGTREEARQRLEARKQLPTLCLSSAPAFLVSNRRKEAYARESIALLGGQS